jgi:hypothetical protein
MTCLDSQIAARIVGLLDRRLANGLLNVRHKQKQLRKNKICPSSHRRWGIDNKSASPACVEMMIVMIFLHRSLSLMLRTTRASSTPDPPSHREDSDNPNDVDLQQTTR